MAHLGKHLAGAEHLGRPALQPEADKCRHRHHDGAPGGHLLEASGDVAAQLPEAQVRSEPGQLGAAPHGAGGDAGARSHHLEAPADEGISRVRTGEDGGDRELTCWAAPGGIGGPPGAAPVE